MLPMCVSLRRSQPSVSLFHVLVALHASLSVGIRGKSAASVRHEHELNAADVIDSKPAASAHIEHELNASGNLEPSWKTDGPFQFLRPTASSTLVGPHVVTVDVGETPVTYVVTSASVPSKVNRSGNATDSSWTPRVQALGSRLAAQNRSEVLQESREPATMKEMLIALGGTSGFNYDLGSNATRARQALRDMRYQHAAATVLILGVFCGFLGTSLSMVYYQIHRRADRDVRYYADLGGEVGLLENDDIDDFLGTFDKSPTSTRLVVTGYQLSARDAVPSRELGFLWWSGQFRRIAFSFSLDLSQWIVNNTEQHDEKLGLTPEDHAALERFLRTDANPFATVEVNKEVLWSGWEDLATNIKTRLRERGFDGTVLVRCEGSERLTVRRNDPWAHFVRHRLTRGLIALSVIGWVFYELYVWLKTTKLAVKSQHKIQMPIEQYWQLIDDKLTPQGFVTPGVISRVADVRAEEDVAQGAAETVLMAVGPVGF